MPHTFKARPTTDFAKENLFNVLSNYMDFEEGVRALDLFAGTGSISIELVSRGCDQVISVEKDRDHYAFICKVMKELKTDKCLPVRGDVFRYIQGSRERFDFIFADPPYGLKELETLPDLIFDNNLLKEDGLFVLEHGKPITSKNILAFGKKNLRQCQFLFLRHSRLKATVTVPAAALCFLPPYGARDVSPNSWRIPAHIPAGPARISHASAMRSRCRI